MSSFLYDDSLFLFLLALGFAEESLSSILFTRETMSNDYKFAGWLSKSPDAVNGKMEWEEYEPKKWEEKDVDVEISHCGICGSDLHTLRSGWGPTNYPCCVG